MRTFRLLSVLVLTGCAAILIAGASQHDVVYPAKSVRIIQTQATVKEGRSHLKAIRQRLITASGEWVETTVPLSNDGPGAPTRLYSNHTGQYAVGRKAESLEVLGQGASPGDMYRSTKVLRTYRDFVGEGSLLGYKTFIWRTETNPGGYLEQHFAPEVSHVPIKFIRHQPNFETVIEPVSIEFIAVTPEMIATPDLPISTKHLLHMADDLDQKGQKETAAKMRAFAASKEQK